MGFSGYEEAGLKYVKNRRSLLCFILFPYESSSHTTLNSKRSSAAFNYTRTIISRILFPVREKSREKRETHEHDSTPVSALAEDAVLDVSNLLEMNTLAIMIRYSIATFRDEISKE